MEANRNTCRICLKQNAKLDWNSEIIENCSITYKDCYYSYTHLEKQTADPHTQMLCGKCLKDLRKSYILVKTALESYRVLEQSFATIVDNEHVTNSEIPFSFQSSSMEVEIVKSEPLENTLEFETVLFNQSEEISQTSKEESNSDDDKLFLKIKIENEKLEESMDYQKTNAEPNSSLSEKETPTSGTEKKKWTQMCQYCSKVFETGYIKSHEATHKEHRERVEICPICETKFYDKNTLNVHLKNIHSRREKRFKCDSCDKAYFNMGGLNIHRRIHLGQMKPCQMCPKKYYRQCDLDKHMATHSATPIHANVKPRVRYRVECKECGKSIPSETFKAHLAFHLNKPIMKCNICNKDFFSRAKCSKHMKQVHQKTRHECTTVYEENFDDRRLTHLKLMQDEKIQPV